MCWSMWSKCYLYRMLHAMLDDVLPSVYMIFFHAHVQVQKPLLLKEELRMTMEVNSLTFVAVSSEYCAIPPYLQMLSPIPRSGMIAEVCEREINFVRTFTDHIHNTRNC